MSHKSKIEMIDCIVSIVSWTAVYVLVKYFGASCIAAFSLAYVNLMIIYIYNIFKKRGDYYDD